MAGAPGVEALVIDLDAHIVVCHSEKAQAAATFKRSSGYHPLLAFLDNTDEFLAGRLRAGNACSNTAADHIAVLDAALEQIPDAYRHGHPILVRADGAGCTKAFLHHVRALREQGANREFSVGWTITQREHTAIAQLTATDWTPASDTDGEPRTLLLHDTPLARAEPKTLRYRLLHVAARLTRGQRRLWLRIDRHWPWAHPLAAAFARLTALPTPAG